MRHGWEGKCKCSARAISGDLHTHLRRHCSYLTDGSKPVPVQSGDLLWSYSQEVAGEAGRGP